MKYLEITDEVRQLIAHTLEGIGVAAEDLTQLVPLAQLYLLETGEHVSRDSGRLPGARVLLDGHLRIELRGVAFSDLGPGSIVDAMGALAPGHAPLFDAIALGSCRVVFFPLDALQALGRERPDVALRLERMLAQHFIAEFHGVAQQRPSALKALVFPEPDLPRTETIKVVIEGETIEAANGVSASNLLPHEVRGALVVAATIDRHVAPLSTRITTDCTLSAVTIATVEGRRIYRRSLCLLTIEAAHLAHPTIRLHAGPSIGFGQLLHVEGVSDLEDYALDVSRSLETVVEEGLDLREEWWSVADARRHFVDEGCDRAARLLDHYRQRAVPLVTYGDRLAFSIGALMPSSHPFAGATLRAHGEDLLLLPPSIGREPVAEGGSCADETRWQSIAEASADHVTRITAVPKQWMKPFGLTSLADLNRHGIDGTLGELIRVAEGAHEKKISHIADQIIDGERMSHLICLAGPSSSGKTTSKHRLEIQLRVAGVTPVGISLDDYFVNRDDTPRDEAGVFDFESFDALRTDLLQEQLGRLLAGEEVQMASFDFLTGSSDPQGGATLQLGEQDVVILEGIHALNPRLLDSLPSSDVFRVFVAPMTSLPIDDLTRLPASDIRLLRRIIRDRAHRGLTAADTIERWASVRRGERRHIFPHQGLADAVFDTSLIYEPAVLKVHAERCLLEVPKEHSSYPAAYRLLQLLDLYVASGDEDVPATSLLREFIGGGLVH